MLERILFDEHSIMALAFAETPDLPSGDAALSEFLRLFFAVLDKRQGASPLVLSAGRGENTSLLPAELLPQEKALEDFLQEAGVPVLRTAASAPAAAETLRKEAEEAGEELLPVTADLSLLQKGTKKLLLVEKEEGTLKTVLWDAAKIRETFGLSEDSFPAFLALSKRLGQKRAQALLQKYGTPEGIREHLTEIPGAHKRDRVSSILQDPAFMKEEAVPVPGLALPAAAPFDPSTAKKVLSSLSKKEEAASSSASETLTGDREEAEALFRRAEEVLQSGGTVGVVPLSDPQRFGKRGPLLGVSLALSERESAFLVVSATENADGAALPEGQLSLFDVPEEKKENASLLTASFLVSHLKSLRLLAGKTKGARLAVFGLQQQFPFWGIEEEEFHDGIHLQGFFDCLIGAYLINPLKNDYTPRDIGTEYLKDDTLPEEKAFLAKKSYGEKLKTEEKEVSGFVQHTARILAESAPKIEDSLRKEEMENLYETIELPLTYVLWDMQRIGIRVLPEKLKKFGDDLTGRIGELDAKIHRETGDPDFNIASPKQLGELLFDRMHLPGGKKTKSGWSTSADILEKLSPDYPVVADILEYRALTKLKSTYADGLSEFIAPDSRIHTTFHQTITATGRISSTDPNLQNIPMRTPQGREIRKVFLPRDGWSFTDSDYSQIELRILASMSGDEALIEAYQGGKDIHRMTASRVFNTPFDEVTDLQRRNAKAVNFGIVYGISSFGLSQGLSISREEAAAYIDQYFKMFPGIKTFLDRQVTDAKTNGYSVTMMGRRRPIPELKESSYMRRQFGERVAMNAPIQGTGADIMKKAMIRVWERLHRENRKSQLILQIHDELLIETAPGEEKDVETILREGMMGAADLKVALEVDCHNGTDWYEAK